MRRGPHYRESTGYLGGGSIRGGVPITKGAHDIWGGALFEEGSPLQRDHMLFGGGPIIFQWGFLCFRGGVPLLSFWGGSPLTRGQHNGAEVEVNPPRGGSAAALLASPFLLLLLLRGPQQRQLLRVPDSCAPQPPTVSAPQTPIAPHPHPPRSPLKAPQVSLSDPWIPHPPQITPFAPLLRSFHSLSSSPDPNITPPPRPPSTL